MSSVTPGSDAISPVSLTKSALNAIKSIREQQDIAEDLNLRLGVKGGGCSGFSYVIGFDELQENDLAFEIEGLKILMDKAEAMYLFGMEVDWVDGLNNRGFSFTNPNAKSTCGCGESFSTE